MQSVQNSLGATPALIPVRWLALHTNSLCVLYYAPISTRAIPRDGIVIQKIGLLPDVAAICRVDRAVDSIGSVSVAFLSSQYRALGPYFVFKVCMNLADAHHRSDGSIGNEVAFRKHV